MYEFSGVVKKVCAVQKFPSGFTKRDLVVEESPEGKWKRLVAFSFKKDNCALLEGVGVGDRVKVSFAVDSREWTDARTGQVKYFTDLTALKLEVEGKTETPPPPAPAVFDEDLSADLDDPEFPF